MRKDFSAVNAALSSPWSNGQTEGQDHQIETAQASDLWQGKIGFAAFALPLFPLDFRA